MLEALRDQVGAGKDAPIVATGYGRKLVPLATRKVTEISCHARGAYHLVGREGALIDVGGQDTKVIRLGPRGSIWTASSGQRETAGGRSPACPSDPDTPRNRLL